MSTMRKTLEEVNGLVEAGEGLKPADGEAAMLQRFDASSAYYGKAGSGWQPFWRFMYAFVCTRKSLLASILTAGCSNHATLIAIRLKRTQTSSRLTSVHKRSKSRRYWQAPLSPARSERR